MTDESNSPPSRNPANGGSMPGAMREILNKFMMNNLEDMLPAKIIAYDRTSNRASVQPMVMMVSTSGVAKSLKQIASVPVLQIGGGGFILNFNLKAGDLGYIKASDRDISLFMQNYSEAAPNTLRQHDFSDGIFIPHVMTGYQINSEDEGNAVLQSLDGSQRIAIWPDRVKITSTNNIILDSPLVTVTGEIITDGSRAAGNANFNGTVTATGDVKAASGSITLETHYHTGVQTGSGNTGGPVG